MNERETVNNIDLCEMRKNEKYSEKRHWQEV